MSSETEEKPTESPNEQVLVLHQEEPSEETEEPAEETDRFYKVSEAQDKLIGKGIRLLACKVLDLITLASKSFTNMDLET